MISYTCAGQVLSLIARGSSHRSRELEQLRSDASQLTVALLQQITLVQRLGSLEL